MIYGYTKQYRAFVMEDERGQDPAALAAEFGPSILAAEFGPSILVRR
jgi:hypothetical protein